MEVVKEYIDKGKIRHVGFSTHGMSTTIIKAIESGVFSYVNLHFHWCGSYTSSGSSKAGNEGNR